MIKRWVLLFVICLGYAHADPIVSNYTPTNGQYPSSKIGIGGYSGDFVDSLYDSNLLAYNNPSFGITMFKEIYLATAGSTTGFTATNPYDTPPTNFFTGFVYKRACHLSGYNCLNTGSNACVSTVASNTNASPPVFTSTGTCSVATAASDIIYVSSPGIPTTSTAGLNWGVGGNGTGALDLTTADQLPATVTGIPLPAVNDCLQVTTVSGGYAPVVTYIDASDGISNGYLFQGNYTGSIYASVQSGSGMTIQMLVTRGSGGATILNQTDTLSGGWTKYTFATSTPAAETNSTPALTVQVQFVISGGPGVVCLKGPYLGKTTPTTNGSTLRDDVISEIKAMNPGGYRWNLLGAPVGCSLLNLLQPQVTRQPCSSPQGVASSYLQNCSTCNPQQTPMGINEAAQATYAICSDHTQCVFSYSIPQDWDDGSTLGNLADFLGGGCGTTYGNYRCLLNAGTTFGNTPWNQLFSRIDIEYNNEPWNSSSYSTFNGYLPYAQYLALATHAALTIEASSNWNRATEKFGAAVQQAFGAQNYGLIHQVDTTGAIDLQVSSAYSILYSPASAACTIATLIQDSVTEVARANLVDNTVGQNGAAISGFPVEVYEGQGNLQTGGCTQSQINGFPEGEAYALVNMLSHAYLQRSFPGKYKDWFFWEFNQQSVGFVSTAPTNPATKTQLWGLYQKLGGPMSIPRPSVYLLAAYNTCAGLGTGYTPVSTGIPTYNSAGESGVPAETNVPNFHTFAFTNGVTNCVVVANTDTVSHTTTWSGSGAPTGNVTKILYGSPNPNDTNESTLTVQTTTSTLTNPTGDTIAPYYAAVYMSSFTATNPHLVNQGPSVIQGPLVVQ